MRWRALLYLCFLPMWLSASSHFYIGPHHNYTRLTFSNPSELKGYQTGITAGYTYCGTCWFGDLSYEGSWTPHNLHGNPCQQSALTEHMGTFRFGVPSSYWDCSWLQPYVGLGYDFLRNEQDPENGGLNYRYRKWTIPVGLQALWCLTDTISLRLQAEWRPDVHARLKVAGISCHNDRRNAYRIQLPLLFCLGCDHEYTIRIVPFFDWNQFGKVDEKNTNRVPFPIPSLIRWSAGARLLFGYAF